MEYLIGGLLPMKKNDLMRYGDNIIRVLKIKDDEVFIIDCAKKSMPRWIKKADINCYCECSADDLFALTNMVVCDIESLDSLSKRKAHERYSLIAGVLPFVDNENKRSEAIAFIANDKGVSKQTIRNYLYKYLVYQDISALAPKSKTTVKELSSDEKNMRWALNRFFYTADKNSLNMAYQMMLKEKYCDGCGSLVSKYPTFHQFRYFYRKYRKMQNFYISRNGLKNYQRNNRPLLGDGVQSFAPAVGVGMLDSTICDIYLVNESGNLVGRPILTACVDAFSGLCCGYSLSWEGGVYSLKSLMSNVITNKVDWCKQFGIIVNQADWNCSSLPATLVTDMGKEYASQNFEQISDLGVTIINLPPYRPELKGVIEKFFDIIQNLYKPHLKGKGIIDVDFQERGAHDYRKDACLTLNDFEKILLHCIVYYNTQRTIDNFPYTDDMLKDNVKPYASCIWNYAINSLGANLIPVDNPTLMLTLLPRTNGKFTRKGLIANKIRYSNDEYTEQYLKGGNAIVAYNPDDISLVWLIEKGEYIPFQIIESRFNGKSLTQVETLQENQKKLINESCNENLQAKINLATHIETIANSTSSSHDVSLKSIRKTRQREQIKTHKDFMKGGNNDG